MINEAEFVKTLGLTRVLSVDSKTLPIEVSNTTRPGIQFAGYWDFFAYERPQLLGKVEMTYLSSLHEDVRRERLAKYFSYPLPCVIICRGYPCYDDMLIMAAAHHVPIYSTTKETVQFELDIIAYLRNALAPRETRHGVLVNVFGTGLLITGNSGVGKSEAALELIKRGHQLVADDVVDIRRVDEKQLIGESPELVRHFMEIRGVGIIDISTMYGVGSILHSKSIDMVIHLEMWQAGKEYDRLGMNDNYTDILGVQVPYLLLPIHPGRNMAVVLEVAARNLRLKQMGYNAANELTRRHMERAMRQAEED